MKRRFAWLFFVLFSLLSATGRASDFSVSFNASALWYDASSGISVPVSIHAYGPLSATPLWGTGNSFVAMGGSLSLDVSFPNTLLQLGPFYLYPAPGIPGQALSPRGYWYSNQLELPPPPGGSFYPSFRPAGVLYIDSAGREIQFVDLLGDNGLAWWGVPELSASTGFVGELSVSPIPEPETYAMLIVGLGFLAWRTQRRYRSRSAVKQELPA